MKVEETLNYRSRVAAERREKTRMKLLHSALIVFSDKGSQAQIADVIQHAGLARGSFYNYFKTNEDILAALAAEINNELIRAIDPIVQHCIEPVERIACGTRLLLHAVELFPQFSSFLARLPIPATDSSLLGMHFLARDIALGVAADQFMHVHQKAAIDFVLGVTFSAAFSLANDAVEVGYPEAIVKSMLMGLGVRASDAARIVAQPLPDLVLPETSILQNVRALQV